MSTSGGQYYSPYVDMTLWNTWHNLPQIAADSGLTSFTLAFIEAVPGSTPAIGWGGTAPLPVDSTNPADPADITTQVQALQAAGDTITISFGGALGTDPAVAVASANGSPTVGASNFGATVAILQAQYQSVITQYGVNHLDFDIERAEQVNNLSANQLRDYAIAGLETANPGLKVSYTLPTTSSGLPVNVGDYNGNVLALLTDAKTDGSNVRIDVVNIMAMQYGNDGDSRDMAIKAESAAQGVESQLTTAGLTATKVGITAMIGVNDAFGTFTTDDAQTLETWAAMPAQQSWVAGLGIWEISRDHPFSADRSDPALNSGVSQTDYQFSHTFDQITDGTTPPPTGVTFIGDATNQTFHGTADGSDTVDYSNATGDIVVNLVKTGAQMPGGGMGTDTLTSIENLIGSGHNDTFVSNTEVDTFTGGGGNDTYYLKNSADVVVEGAGGGIDKVFTDVSYALSANAQVEYLYANVGSNLTLTGNAYTTHLIGGSGADHLIGGSGDELLDGRGGADVMEGGAGNDTYYVNDSGDQIIEGAGDSHDSAYVSVNKYVLAPDAQVEFLYVNSPVARTLTGNDYSNHIFGGVGNDRLNGGNGDDFIQGRGGADFLTGNGGHDTFVYNAVSESTATPGGFDKILDFLPGTDHIDLSNIDANTNTGANDAFSFIGTNAFSHTAGELRYAVDNTNHVTNILGDVNGDGEADFQIQLTGTLTVHASDFVHL